MILETFYFQKKLDTIEDHHNKHTSEDQGCSWTTPLKNCLSDVFFIWVLIRHPIFWEIKHFLNSKRMELRKKENSISKGKEKERREWFWKKYFKKTGHNRGPPQQPYYLGSILLMKKKLKQGNTHFFRQQLDTIEDHHNKDINYVCRINIAHDKKQKYWPNKWKINPLMKNTDKLR